MDAQGCIRHTFIYKKDNLTCTASYKCTQCDISRNSLVNLKVIHPLNNSAIEISPRSTLGGNNYATSRCWGGPFLGKYGTFGLLLGNQMIVFEVFNVNLTI